MPWFNAKEKKNVNDIVDAFNGCVWRVAVLARLFTRRASAFTLRSRSSLFLSKAGDEHLTVIVIPYSIICLMFYCVV